MQAKRRDPRAHPEYGLFLVGQCRFDEAVTLADEWSDLDPGVGAQFAFGWIQHKRRQFEASTEQLEFVVDHWPGFAWAPFWLAGNCAFLGRSEQAVKLAHRALDAAPWHSIGRGYAGAIFGAAGAADDARAILRSFEVIGREGGHVDPFNLALVHAGLGEKEEAFAPSRAMRRRRIGAELDHGAGAVLRRAAAGAALPRSPAATQPAGVDSAHERLK
jgi:tetratricopeptide (TPR) repeat protein